MRAVREMTAGHVVWPVLREHLGAAGWAWSRWLDERSAPDLHLSDLAERERRLLAQVDALVVGGAPVQEQLLLPTLEGRDAGLAFAAACALLRSEVGDRSAAVIARLRTAGPEARRGIAGALELAAPDALDHELRALQELADPPLQALVTDVLSCRRLTSSPRLGAPGESAPQLLAAVARAALHPGGEAHRPALGLALASPEPAARDAALESACILGSARAWQRCRELVAEQAPSLRLPLTLLALSGDPGDARLLARCLEVESLRPDALWALGFLGTVEAADTCLALIRESLSPRQAGEAFSFITGLDLQQQGLALPARPEGESSDRWLPLPDAAGLDALWREARARFVPSVRYLLGSPFSRESFLAALAAASLRRRQGLLLEAALRTRGACLVEPRALSRVQRQQEAWLLRAEASAAFSSAWVSPPRAEQGWP